MPKLPSPLEFFGKLRWLDGKPLLGAIEPYRQALFVKALHTLRPDGTPLYNFILAGRSKKNSKTCDLVLAGFYKQLIPHSVQGNDVLLVASDEGQAGDALDLAKKLVRANPILDAELEITQKEIRRRDGQGAMKVLPAGDAAGAHGKTFGMVGIDEVHTHRTWDLLEALQPDPTRPDTLTWITSYDTIWNSPGTPLFDLKQRGITGDDPRMLFSWYSGDLCTDPDFAELPPEQRANPSMASWPEGPAYLEQQRRRLPAFKYRRLHLNLPGAPSGAYLDPDMVCTALVTGRKVLPPGKGIKYAAFVDMSGGSSDDATVCIAHKADSKVIVDLVEKQAGRPPFNPRDAVRKFAGIIRSYGLSRVVGDKYAGETFRRDFEAENIAYETSRLTKSDLYEQIEPRLNACEIELPDVPVLREQLLGLVLRGSKIDHIAGEHDDFANAVAGVVAHVTARRGEWHAYDYFGRRLRCDGEKDLPRVNWVDAPASEIAAAKARLAAHRLRYGIGN
jgi:hypothetical protein